MIWDASKAVSNQAKEGIGGKMLAAFGSDNRHSTPPREGIKWFPREGYCRMEVYEKAMLDIKGSTGFYRSPGIAAFYPRTDQAIAAADWGRRQGGVLYF